MRPRGEAEWRAAVEAEYDEPLAQVIAGYRAQQVGWALMADLLGTAPKKLRQVAHALGVHDGRRRGERAHVPSLDDRAQALGYANMTEMLRDYLTRTPPLAIWEIAGLVKAHRTSLTRYVPLELKGVYSRLTSRRGAYMEHLRRRYDRHHSHPTGAAALDDQPAPRQDG